MTALSSWRQLPKNARVFAATSAVVPLLVIAGCGQESAPLATSTSTSATTTTTSTTTTTTPPPVTVSSVVDGRTVTLSNGTSVQVTGLAPPGECWATSAAEFATNTLVGKAVSVAGSRLLLADGSDYAVLAVSKGVARAVSGADAAIQAAEAVAKQSSTGFWGPSCGGLDVKPAPQPVVPQPQPVVPQPQPAPVPAPPPPPAAAYYANCSAAKAAGAAPLYRGQPGYRSALDRDNDGVACE
ncbi:excalibur calcium-binding domain-containing protein [Lentzea sp. NPDC051838]|uniref:excalibur calcium-binding domain-containing protein n=1 Tax=Lentzea sp. NPDC051838 TaxID=3154849 RepID=UPI0034386873